MAHIWERSYPPGVSWGDPLPAAVAIESLLETAAETWQDKAAIDFYDRRLSFREIERLAARAALGLQALGVGPGIHVGLHLPNTPHYVVCFFAVLMAGGRVVNFSPLAAPRELKYQIADSDVQVMVTLDLPTLYPQVALVQRFLTHAKNTTPTDLLGAKLSAWAARMAALPITRKTWPPHW